MHKALTQHEHRQKLYVVMIFVFFAVVGFLVRNSASAANEDHSSRGNSHSEEYENGIDSESLLEGYSDEQKQYLKEFCETEANDIEGEEGFICEALEMEE